ncbi:MAG: hypothetical protein LBG96_16710 [Tannerella sp.]|nr:hypothetical protein [Tannerella sp.]
MDDLIKRVGVYAGVPVSDMKTRRGGRKTSRARQAFMYLSRHVLGETDSDIALFLGCSQQNISYQITGVEHDMRIYYSVRNMIDDIRSELEKKA